MIISVSYNYIFIKYLYFAFSDFAIPAVLPAVVAVVAVLSSPFSDYMLVLASLPI
jgi:hypothetical protein